MPQWNRKAIKSNDYRNTTLLGRFSFRLKSKRIIAIRERVHVGEDQVLDAMLLGLCKNGIRPAMPRQLRELDFIVGKVAFMDQVIEIGN
jgi:hypothetical protein